MADKSKRFVTHVGFKKVTVRTNRSSEALKKVSDKLNGDLKVLSIKQPDRSYEDLMVLLALNSYSQEMDLSDELQHLKEEQKYLMERNQQLEQRIAELNQIAQEVAEKSQPETPIEKETYTLKEVEQKQEAPFSAKASMLTHRYDGTKKKPKTQNSSALAQQLTEAPRRLEKLRRTPRS